MWCSGLTQPVLLRETSQLLLPFQPVIESRSNVQTSGTHRAGSHPQDQGAFLCVVDDSNEHMLSVWDCSRGVKLAEIKVRSLGGLMVSESGVGREWWNTDSPRFTYIHTYTFLLRQTQFSQLLFLHLCTGNYRSSSGDYSFLGDQLFPPLQC